MGGWGWQADTRGRRTRGGRGERIDRCKNKQRERELERERET